MWKRSCASAGVISVPLSLGLEQQHLVWPVPWTGAAGSFTQWPQRTADSATSRERQPRSRGGARSHHRQGFFHWWPRGAMNTKALQSQTELSPRSRRACLCFLCEWLVSKGFMYILTIALKRKSSLKLPLSWIMGRKAFKGKKNTLHIYIYVHHIVNSRRGAKLTVSRWAH